MAFLSSSWTCEIRVPSLLASQDRLFMSKVKLCIRIENVCFRVSGFLSRIEVLIYLRVGSQCATRPTGCFESGLIDFSRSVY